MKHKSSLCTRAHITSSCMEEGIGFPLILFTDFYHVLFLFNYFLGCLVIFSYSYNCTLLINPKYALLLLLLDDFKYLWKCPNHLQGVSTIQVPSPSQLQECILLTSKQGSDPFQVSHFYGLCYLFLSREGKKALPKFFKSWICLFFH